MKKVLLSALALLAIAGSGFTQNLPSYIPANGLVGWWPFNGNANDESGNGNNGTVNGATLTTDRFGNTDKAYFFDGVNDYIRIPDDSSLDITGNISISAWIMPSTLGPYRIIDKSTAGGSDAYMVDIFPSTTGFYNRIRFIVAQSQSSQPQSSIFGLTTNQYFHILVTYDLNSVSFYVNGFFLNSIPKTSLSSANNNSLLVGANSFFNGTWFHGVIDDIAIYNRALSQQEITSIFTAENNPVSCANDLSLTPSSLQLNSGSTASFSASTTDPNPQYRWQSDLGLGFQDLSNVGQYSGVSSNNLQVAGLKLRNHQQKFRVISTSGNCVDTSAVATISLSDTCINVVNDTNLVTVTDTLIITITANPGLVQNTLKAYPNPTAGMLFISTGNYAAMPDYSIRIASATGQEVYNAVVDQALLQVPLESLSPEGLFYLRLYDASGALVTTRKIVLQ